jgi:hypothetical protein
MAEDGKGDVHLYENATRDDKEKIGLTGEALQLSDDVDATKQSPWTKSMFRLYGVLAVAYLCGCLNGYDGSLMGGLNALTNYQHYFGL